MATATTNSEKPERERERLTDESRERLIDESLAIRRTTTDG
jgi:hypothetical protein